VKVQALLATLSCLLGASNGPAFTYPDFSSITGLNLTGDAAQVTTLLRLTTPAQNLKGAAWYTQKQPVAGGFTTSFRFRITNLGSSGGIEAGGDGISFAVQNSGISALATEYGAETNSISTGLGVSLNTFFNAGLEPSGNFIGITSNGSHWLIQRDLNGSSIDLSDGNEHLVQITCDGNSMSVGVDGTTFISNFPVSLGFAADGGGNSWVGFGARTGGAFENHDILNWSFSSGAPPPTNCVAAPSGLVSWWRGEGSTADAADANHTTVAGFGTFGYGPGVVGQAFVFDGIHRDRVDVGNPINLQLQDFTIEAWIKRSSATDISLDDNNQDGAVAGEGGLVFGYGRGGYGLGLLNDGHLLLSKIDVDGVFSTGVVSDTNWHHVAVTKSGATTVFYIDGASASGAIAYTTTYTFDTSASIGSRGDARGGTFFGMIDEPSVYGRSLSASEIQAIYRADGAGKCRAPVPPLIVSQPMSQTAFVGDTVTFGVGAAGDAPLRCQWRFNGLGLIGKTNTSLTLSNVHLTNGGNYSVLVTNAGGSAISSNALLTVNPIMSFSNCFSYSDFSSTDGLALVGSAASVGGALRLTPAAGGQVGDAWRVDKQLCSDGFDTRFQFRISNPGGASGGGDGIALTIQNTGPAAAAAYTVLGAGTNYTSVFFNTFWNWPDSTDYQRYDISGNSIGIVTNNLYVAQTNLNPLGINLKDGAVHQARVAFDGAALTVWLDGLKLLDRIPVPGLKAGTDGSGQGWVGFDAFTGGAWESHDVLSWSFCSPPRPPVPPTIVSQPADQVAFVGDKVTFNVVAAGDPPLSYQWLFKGFNTFVRLMGETNASLTLANVQLTNAGNYSVRVSNPAGSIVSSNALLTVIPVTTYSNCLSYTDFSSANGLALAGNSATIGGALRLTPAAGDQLGNAWRVDKQQCSGSFDCRFQFQITGAGSRPGTPSGGDGFAFVIQNVGPEAADSFNGLGNGTNYTCVFFNTFWNWPGCTDYQHCDVSDNSIGVATNNVYVAQQDLNPLGINLKDGAVHQGRIAFDGAAITVWIDHLKVLDSVPAPGLKPGTDRFGDGWVGFNARTGWAWENHDILSWSFCSAQQPHLNHAPVARITVSPLAQFPWLTDSFVISPDNSDALVALDGSKSSDPDQDPLTYAWWEGTNDFADGVISSNVLAVGSHTITLVVSDGVADAAATATVKVITASDAIRLIILLIEASDLDPNRQHALIAILQAAAAGCDRGDFGAGVNELQAFQNEVRAQVAPSDPVLGGTLFAAAQQVITALGGGGPGNHRGATFRSVTCVPGGNVRLSFAGTPGQASVVQASTNLIDWETIGVATDHGDGSFDFEDTDTWRFSCRFYRIVSP
jgi:hypothetical protein